MAHRPLIILLALSLMALVALFLALSVGSVAISANDFLAVILGRGDPLHDQIITELRLPRALGAFTCGGLLALAGVLMQALLRNPLADPYILGISGGAAVATLIAITLGVSGILLTGSAVFGALLSMMLVFGLAHGQGSWTPTRLLLTGVVVAAGWGAVISFLLAIAPQKNLHSMLFWLMGDLSYVKTYWPGIMSLAFGLGVSLIISRHLNVLLHGDLQASALGINVARLRISLYFVASLLTATAVTIAGSIGFIGLIVPHLLRLLGINDHRLLLPSAVLLGGALLVVADTASRVIIAPQQLPVGVITAMLGVPVFLFLMQRSGRHP